MAIASVRQALINRLRLLPNIDNAPDYPTPNLADGRTLFVYAVPGSSSIQAHTGSHRGLPFRNLDRFIIEYHCKIQPDRLADGIQITEEMCDLMRFDLWSAFNEDRFNGTAISIGSIDTNAYGDLGWGSDTSFGFRLSIEIGHADET